MVKDPNSAWRTPCSALLLLGPISYVVDLFTMWRTAIVMSRPPKRKPLRTREGAVRGVRIPSSWRSYNICRRAPCSSWPHLLTCRKKETKGSRGVRVVQHSGRGDSKTTGVLGTVKHHREVNKSVRAGQMDSVPLSYHEDGVAFTTSGVLHR